jgi:hypothetical protein
VNIDEGFRFAGVSCVEALCRYRAVPEDVYILELLRPPFPLARNLVHAACDRLETESLCIIRDNLAYWDATRATMASTFANRGFEC